MVGPSDRDQIAPEAELVGDSDQRQAVLGFDRYEDVSEGRRSEGEGTEGTAWAFEAPAEQAKLDGVLDKELEGSFPTSDSSSSRDGPDVELERPEDTPAK